MLASLPSASNDVQHQAYLFGAFRDSKKKRPATRDAYGMRRGPMLALGFRLRRHPQIRAQCLVAFRKLLLDDLGVLQRGNDYDVVTVFPVDRRCNLIVFGQLNRDRKSRRVGKESVSRW